jgi:hypothetical protein
VGLLLSVYGVKLHLMCATNRVPISYELTPANVADLSLTEELLAEADLGEEEVARKLLGDLAYRSGELEEELAGVGIMLLSSEASARRPGGSGSRSRSAFRVLSGFSGSRRLWREPSWDWLLGS